MYKNSSFLILLFFYTLTIPLNGQTPEEKKIKISDRFFTQSPACYHYINLNYSRMYSQNFYGIQYKRLKCDGEIGFSIMGGYSMGLNYSRKDSKDYLISNIEGHFMAFPFTLVFRLGIGINYLTDFNNENYISAYPSVSFDLGGIELGYNYNLNKNLSAYSTPHCLKIKIGIWVHQTPLYRED